MASTTDKPVDSTQAAGATAPDPKKKSASGAQATDKTTDGTETGTKLSPPVQPG